MDHFNVTALGHTNLMFRVTDPPAYFLEKWKIKIIKKNVIIFIIFEAPEKIAKIIRDHFFKYEILSPFLQVSHFITNI